MTVDPGEMVPQHPAFSLHRTPLHLDLLSAVSERRIEFCPEAGPRGRFARLGQRVITRHEECAALYELEHAGLIERHGRVVAATAAGRCRLADWAVSHG